MLPASFRGRKPSVGVERVCTANQWVPTDMTEVPQTHDQDADPPTADGEEPDSGQLLPGSEPASDPDPDPGTATTQDQHEEDA